MAGSLLLSLGVPQCAPFRLDELVRLSGGADFSGFFDSAPGHQMRKPLIPDGLKGFFVAISKTPGEF